MQINVSKKTANQAYQKFASLKMSNAGGMKGPVLLAVTLRFSFS